MAFAGHSRALSLAKDSQLREQVDSAALSASGRTIQSRSSVHTPSSPTANDKIDESDTKGNPPTSSLWVGNIPVGIAIEEIEKLFSRYGVIKSVRVPTGKPYAFVNYLDVAAAIHACIELHGQYLFNNEMPNHIHYQRSRHSVSVEGPHNGLRARDDISPPPLRRALKHDLHRPSTYRDAYIREDNDDGGRNQQRTKDGRTDARDLADATSEIEDIENIEPRNAFKSRNQQSHDKNAKLYSALPGPGSQDLSYSLDIRPHIGFRIKGTAAEESKNLTFLNKFRHDDADGSNFHHNNVSAEGMVLDNHDSSSTESVPLPTMKQNQPMPSIKNPTHGLDGLSHKASEANTSTHESLSIEQFDKVSERPHSSGCRAARDKLKLNDDRNQGTGYSFLGSIVDAVNKTDSLGLPLTLTYNSLRSKNKGISKTTQPSGPRLSITPSSDQTSSSKASTLKKRCSDCRKPEMKGVPLIWCSKCPRRYHKVCGDPRPDLNDLSNFVCGRCLYKAKQALLRKISTPGLVNDPVSGAAAENVTEDERNAIKNSSRVSIVDQQQHEVTKPEVSVSSIGLDDLDKSLGQGRALDVDAAFDPDRLETSEAVHVDQKGEEWYPDGLAATGEETRCKTQCESPKGTLALVPGITDKQVEPERCLPEATLHTQKWNPTNFITTSHQDQLEFQQSASAAMHDLATNDVRRPWLTINKEYIRQCEDIGNRYRTGVTCDKWPDRCYHTSDCRFAHWDTGVYLPQYGGKAKAWTCPSHPNCPIDEEQCRFSHLNTGLYVRPDGRAESLKHLTCLFWYRDGRCNKAASECNFAHRWTGLVTNYPAKDQRRMTTDSLPIELLTNPSSMSLMVTSPGRYGLSPSQPVPTWTKPPFPSQLSPGNLPRNNRSLAAYEYFTNAEPRMNFSQKFSDSIKDSIQDPRYTDGLRALLGQGMSPTKGQCSKDKSENDTSVLTDSQNTDKQSVSSQGKLANEDYRRKSTNKCKSCGKVVWKSDICTSCQKEHAEPVDATLDRADKQRSSASSPQQSLFSSSDILGDIRLLKVLMPAVSDASSKHEAQPSMARSIKRKRESLTMFSKKRLKPDLSILAKASSENFSKAPAMLESTFHAPKQESSTGTWRRQQPDKENEEGVVSSQNVTSAVKSATTEARVPNISSTDEIAEYAIEHDDATLDHTEETPLITEPDTLSGASFGDNDSDAPLVRRRPNSRPDQDTNHKQDLWSDTTNESQEADVPPGNPGIDVHEVDDSSDVRPARRSRPCDCSTKHNKCLHNEQGELDVRKCFLWMSEGHHRKSNRGRQQLQDIAEATQRYVHFCENSDGLDPYSEGARLKYLQHQQFGQAIKGYSSTSDAVNTSLHPHTRSLDVPDSRLSPRAPDIRYEDVVPESAVEITPPKLIFEVQDDIQELQQQQLTIRNVSRTRHLIFKITLPDFAFVDIKVDTNKGNIKPQSTYTIKVAMAPIADKNYCLPELNSKTSTSAELEIGYAYLKGASIDDVGWFQKEFSARRQVTLECIDLRLSTERDATVLQPDASQLTEQPHVTDLPLSKVPAAPLASDTALSPELQARRNKVGHDFYDLYFMHLHNASAVVDAVLRGVRKDNTLSIVKVIQLAHSRMYHRLVSARSLNKAGFEQLGLRDVRKALEEYAEQHHTEVHTPLESGWTRDGHDVIWKIGKPHTASHLHISSPLPRADQFTERLELLGMANVHNRERPTAMASTIQDALNESSQRPSIKLILKVPSGPQSFDRQSASTASCNTTSTLPESITQPPLGTISERLANFPPTPESDRPTPQREGLSSHDIDASDLVDTNDEDRNMHVQDVMARMKARGIQFEDASVEDSNDELIIQLGDHVSKHITSGVKFTNESVQLPRITKKQGLKHIARQRLIQDRQRSRNVQMTGNPHEECDKKHVKQPRLTAWVDHKILADRTKDRYASDSISSRQEKITYAQFLGIPEELEPEPCVIRNGKSVQLAFREKQERYGEIGRVKSKRLKGQLWPVSQRE